MIQQRTRENEGTPAGLTPARLTPAGLTPDFAHLATPRNPKRARAILLWVIGGSAAIGAFLVGLFYALGADGAPPEGVGETVGATLVGGVQGAIVGVAFGLVLALPAAITAWFLRRGRRGPDDLTSTRRALRRPAYRESEPSSFGHSPTE